MKALAYGLVFGVPVLLVLGARLGSWWTLLPVAYVFVLLPLFDELAGDGGPEGPGPARRWIADLPMLLWVPVQLGSTAWTVQRVAAGHTSPWETLGLALSVGVMCGAGGITIAHELMHRHEAWARGLAELLMGWVSYPHFCVEHVHGHHRHVATPHDPATSRRGETVYRFYVRSVVGGLRSAWRLEGERIRRAGRLPHALADRRIRYPLLLAVLYAAVLAAWGPAGLAFFVAQGVVAFSMLEIVNYLEHYGLERRRLDDGRFERVAPHHSWNSGRWLSNGFLFNLARHSDHHHLASRPYDALRSVPDAPQLPAGYSAMMLLALVPPAWFRVMDPRVEHERRLRWKAANPLAERLTPASQAS
jgi:alkane 1-monooxygenase